MSSNLQRLLDYHVGRLKDKNRDVRLRAIKELELLNHTGALDPLRSIYENDRDAEVRKAAQEAGRAIFANQQKKSES